MHTHISPGPNKRSCSEALPAKISVSLARLSSGESEVPNVNWEMIHFQYQDLAPVFSNNRAIELPAQQPYDLSIDLQPAMTPPCGRPYSLSTQEQKAMEEYFAEGLRQGTLQGDCIIPQPPHLIRHWP